MQNASWVFGGMCVEGGGEENLEIFCTKVGPTNFFQPYPPKAPPGVAGFEVNLAKEMAYTCMKDGAQGNLHTVLHADSGGACASSPTPADEDPGPCVHAPGPGVVPVHCTGPFG